MSARKLTPEKVAEIRRLGIQGLPFTHIAKLCGVSRYTASRYAQDPLALWSYHTRPRGTSRTIPMISSDEDLAFPETTDAETGTGENTDALSGGLAASRAATRNDEPRGSV